MIRKNRIMPEERRFVTVLFADLSGFTALTQDLDPEDTQEVVNTCFDKINKSIIQHGGTIHKYQGDLVIALFGVPVTYEDDCERAIKASLDMMNVIPEINAQLGTMLQTRTDLGLHIGINSGTVVVGKVGSKDKYEYTVMGHTVNLGSRLKDVAKRGEILVSEPVFSASRYLFDYAALPPLIVKGIDEEVRVFKPINIKKQPEPRRGIKGLHSSLVGRYDELQKLKNAVDGLVMGKGSAVFIIGHAGLGKTRLWEELRQYITKNDIGTGTRKGHAKQSPIWILEGQCPLHGESLNYWPLLQILKDIFRITDLDPDESVKEKLLLKAREFFPKDYKEYIPYIGYMLSTRFNGEFDEKIKHLDAEALKEQIFISMRRLLSVLCSKQPTIFVIEDYHWIDTASLELLEYLIDVPGSLPLLFLVLTRPEKEKACYKAKDRFKQKLGDGFEEIILEPLSSDASSTLVYNLLNIPGFSEEFKDKILIKAEGNPFYIEEILRSYIDGGILVYKSNTWHLDVNNDNMIIPDSIQSVITSRVDCLEPDTRNVLQQASVIGKMFYERILEYLSGYDNLMLILHMATLSEFEFIREIMREPELVYVFKHYVTQEVVYNTLLKKQRRQLHNKVGECIERFFAKRITDFYELLAQQYYLGENWTKSYEYSLNSARKARSCFLNRQALQFYGQAIESVRQIKDTLSQQHTGLTEESIIKREIMLLIEKSSVLDLTGEIQNAFRVINTGLRLARKIDDKKSEADCLYQLSQVYGSTDEYKKMLAALNDSFSYYQEINDKKGVAKCINAIGYVYTLLNDYGKALEYHTKALKMYEDIKDRNGHADCLNNIGGTYYNLCDYDKALEHLTRSMQINEEIGNLQGQAPCLNNIGGIYYTLGDYEKALEYFIKTLKILEEIGYKRRQAYLNTNIGGVYWRLGDYEKALEYCEKALVIEKVIDDQSGQAQSFNNIGSLYWNLGKFRNALKYHFKSVEIKEKTGDRNGLGLSYSNIGNVYACLGDYAEALDYYLKALKILDEIGDNEVKASCMCGIGRVYFEQGDYKQALQYLVDGEKIANEIGKKETLRKIVVTLGELALAQNKLDQANKYLALALKCADELKSKSARADAYILQTMIKFHVGDLKEAEKSIKESISLYKKLNQPFDIARAYYYYGELYKAKDDKPNARKYFKKAKELFKKLGAKHWVTKLSKA